MSYQLHARAARGFGRAMKFGAWLTNLPNRLTPPPFRLMQISSGFWLSRALYVAARLDIAGALGDATMDAAEIARRVDANADATARLMRLLAAVGVFEETAPQTYRNNKLSAPLRNDHPQSVRAMVLMHNSPEMSRPWFQHLEQGVREGQQPFVLEHGDELFDYMDKHAEFDALFSQAMDSVEALSGDAYATDFDWSRFTRVIDVGGSRGSKSLSILRRHPRLTALVVDRPQVVEEAQGTGLPTRHPPANGFPSRPATRATRCRPPAARAAPKSHCWRWCCPSRVPTSLPPRSTCRCSWARAAASAPWRSGGR